MAYRSPRVPRSAFLFRALAASLAPLAVLEAPIRARAASQSNAALPAAHLGPLINIPQTWNNCGPAAVAEVLAYWGIARTQAQVQAILRVDGPSAGMTPFGVPAYARSLGLRTLSGAGGSVALVKGLIAGGFPVIVHQVVSLADLTGHWRPIEAYDDRQGVFVASDPYLGPDHAIGYGDFARIWALRGQAFVVLYPASHQAALSSIVARSGWDRAAAYVGSRIGARRPARCQSGRHTRQRERGLPSTGDGLGRGAVGPGSHGTSLPGLGNQRRREPDRGRLGCRRDPLNTKARRSRPSTVTRLYPPTT